MKLSNVFAKLTFVKSNVVRVAAAVALAGAALTVAAPTAGAQRVVVGFGGPRVFVAAPPIRYYADPVYVRDNDRRDWRFRHDFDRDRDFDRHYDRDFDRHHDRDHDRDFHR